MRPSSKQNSAKKPSPRPVLWWRPWVWGLSSVLFFLIMPPEAWAQAERKRPARANENGKAVQVPAREATAAPLSAKKLEEALQLLLRADSARTQSGGGRGPESSGLVVDQTITKIGHDFYDVFYAQWEPPTGLQDFTIVISERPARGNSAIVAVSVNDTELLEMPLQPKYELIEEAAGQAIYAAYALLQEQQNVSRQLERGELRGLETY
ncbi:curli production assembly/transport protein CsgE [Hymenobacter pini]|uniref:curli production assembly/transport protein CsgE n=1 Tax=Hymenobacter pini TaxID=2880879 RepID=UPI001CF3ABFD|nr:curli production assembly/transport protein CsgE [Hymenobacter pini]MCA8829456.1 curli production assembly/transport protein CsgE [Hymenobacter pini]